MRLTEAEIDGIKTAAREWFGAPVPVRLFGSRIDDSKKGGDIDLLVETPPGRATFSDEIGLAARLDVHLGERKIDILLVEPGQPLDPMQQIAMRDGVLR